MSRRAYALTTVAALAILVGAPAAAWGITVAFSGVKGQGDAIVERNSSENWTAAQARFEDLYAGIQSADAKIGAAAEVLEAHPDDRTYQQTYSGLVSGCLTLVGDYNAEARKFLSQDFRAADLPIEIDPHNPRTDCHE